jgi:phospholipase/carboxylesterase
MATENSDRLDFHAGQPVLHLGAPIKEAAALLIMVHGRGSTARDILSLASEFDAPGVAFVAPQAAGGTWYPNRFVAPVESNEPWLSSALQAISRVLENSQEAGTPLERTALLGFSQGACLALEYAARQPARYGGVAALSGGLIENGDRVRNYSGDLARTPVFLGCSDVDPHIPIERVHRSEEVMTALGGVVTKRIYAGMGHTVNRDEIDWVQAMLTFMLV